MLDENAVKTVVAVLALGAALFQFSQRRVEQIAKRDEIDAKREGAAMADLGKFRQQLLARIAELEDECEKLRSELRDSRAEIGAARREYFEIQRECNLVKAQSETLSQRLTICEARLAERKG